VFECTYIGYDIWVTWFEFPFNTPRDLYIYIYIYMCRVWVYIYRLRRMSDMTRTPLRHTLRSIYIYICIYIYRLWLYIYRLRHMNHITWLPIRHLEISTSQALKKPALNNRFQRLNVESSHIIAEFPKCRAIKRPAYTQTKFKNNKEEQ